MRSRASIKEKATPYGIIIMRQYYAQRTHRNERVNSVKKKLYIAVTAAVAILSLAFCGIAAAESDQAATPTIWTYYDEYMAEIEDDRDTYAYISCDTPGAIIYYTLDGTEPDNTKQLYEGHWFNIPLKEDTIVKAIAYREGMQPSQVATLSYKKLLGTPNTWAPYTHAALGQGYKYYGEDGRLVNHGWVSWNGEWYYMDDYFMMRNMLLSNNTGAAYFFKSDGRMARGWARVEYEDGNSYWHYFDPETGLSVEKAGGWKLIDGKYYKFGHHGIMITGWVRDSTQSQWLYLDETDGSDTLGAMKTGWFKVKGVWYHADNTGCIQYGWQKLDGGWYYMDGSGAMVTGARTIGGKRYVFDGAGRWIG